MTDRPTPEEIDWIPGSPETDGHYWIFWAPDQRVELVAIGPAYIHRNNPNANRLMKLIDGIAYQYEPNRESISYYAPIVKPTFDRAEPQHVLYTIRLTKREMDVAREWIARTVTIPSDHPDADQDNETAESVIAKLEALGAKGTL